MEIKTNFEKFKELCKNGEQNKYEWTYGYDNKVSYVETNGDKYYLSFIYPFGFERDIVELDKDGDQIGYKYQNIEPIDEDPLEYDGVFIDRGNCFEQYKEKIYDKKTGKIKSKEWCEKWTRNYQVEEVSKDFEIYDENLNIIAQLQSNIDYTKNNYEFRLTNPDGTIITKEEVLNNEKLAKLKDEILWNETVQKDENHTIVTRNMVDMTEKLVCDKDNKLLEKDKKYVEKENKIDNTIKLKDVHINTKYEDGVETSKDIYKKYRNEEKYELSSYRHNRNERNSNSIKISFKSNENGCIDISKFEYDPNSPEYKNNKFDMENSIPEIKDVFNNKLYPIYDMKDEELRDYSNNGISGDLELTNKLNKKILDEKIKRLNEGVKSKQEKIVEINAKTEIASDKKHELKEQKDKEIDNKEV